MSTDMVLSDIRTVEGTVLESLGFATSVKAPSGSVASQSLNRIGGIKVYTPHNPSVFALTDANGRFRLTVDLTQFKAWKKKNGLSSLYGNSETATESIPLCAERIVQLSDGTTAVKSTVIPIEFSPGQTSIDLDEIFDSENNTNFWIKVNATVSGVCRLENNLAGSARVVFFENSTGQIVTFAVTDANGAYSISISPGNYRVVISIEGFEPLTIRDFMIREGEKKTKDFSVPHVVKGGTTTGTTAETLAGTADPIPPAFIVTANGAALQGGQSITLLKNATLSVDIGVFDPDGGLGMLSGSIGGSELFPPVIGTQSAFLSQSFTRVFSIPGTYTFGFSARDFDRIATLTPTEPGYYRVRIPRAGSAGFTNSVGVKVIGTDGSVKFNGILIPDANYAVGSFADVKIFPGEQVIPFMHVNMKTHRVSGVPQEYDRYLGSFDPYKNFPVAKTEFTSDGKLMGYFEDCMGIDPWCDQDYNDVIFEAWFTKEPVESSEKIIISPYPTHTVEFKFSVNVQPIIVEPGRITGHVIDDQTGAPIAGALVAISGTDINTMADDSGYFELPNLKSGTYDLIATANGYRVKTFPGIVVP